VTAASPAGPAAGADTQWVKCPSCDAFVYAKRLVRNLKVCPECNHHFRLRVRERLAQLLDEGSFEDLGKDIVSTDILGFVDSKPYTTRLEEAKKKSGNNEAAVFGTGTVSGYPLVLAAMDFGFMGGSMGGGVGEIITQAAEHALETSTPLLIIAASGGARMQEGCVSLMQLAKTSQAVAKLHEAGVLVICLNTDPTYGGVTASFAMLGDVLVAEPNAMVGFAGPSVIEQTIRQKLPPGFQTAEFLMEHGMLDLVEPRENMRNTLRKLLALHAPRPDGAKLPEPEGEQPITDPANLRQRDSWDAVTLARHIDRPTTLEYIGFMFDDFIELHGDRLYRENASIVGGVALLGDLPVVVIGHQKGHTTTEMVGRNFGMPDPEGYRKALRLMHHAEKFGMPLITIIDTPGAYPGLGAEERGQAVAIARCIMEMSRLPIPAVAVVTGEGGSGGALALGVGDRVLMMENSYYSVISPEGCSTILFNDATAAPRAAAALKVTPPDLLRLGIMDAIIPEPEEGAHTDPVTTAANFKTALLSCLTELLPLDGDELVEARYARFRAFGGPDQASLSTQEPS
jgi:acetyl-CoA carboxylase carboxyl transferase subunit beta